MSCFLDVHVHEQPSLKEDEEQEEEEEVEVEKDYKLWILHTGCSNHSDMKRFCILPFWNLMTVCIASQICCTLNPFQHQYFL